MSNAPAVPMEAINMDNYLKVLRALTDETRLRILNLLYERELCVCDIGDILGAPQTKVSRHLAYMRSADLVRDRKIAQWSFYSLNGSGRPKYVDELVLDVLRSLDVYKRDLGLLKKKERSGLCLTNSVLNNMRRSAS